MTEHLRTEEIERLSQRTMSAAELVNAYDHLAACETCRQQASEGMRPQESFASLFGKLHTEAAQEPDHLSYEQAVAYVDGESEVVEREIVASHLAWCEMCGGRVDELRAFKAELNATPASRPAVADTSRPSLWEKLAAFWSSSKLGWQLVAAALLLFGGWAAMRLLRGPAPKPMVKDSPEQQTAHVPTPTPNARETAQPVLLALNDASRQITLDQQGNLAGLDNLSPLDAQAVRTALTAERIELSSDAAMLADHSESLLRGQGEGIAFALRNPVGTAVSSARPTFRWRPLKEAKSYTVTIYDADFNRVTTSPQLDKAEWTPQQPLPRGKRYSWQVTAQLDGQEVVAPQPPAPQAKFIILDREKADNLERAKQSAGESHLALGVIYAKAGLLDDGEREFRALLQANPSSTVAQKLLHHLQSQRR